MIDTLVSYKTAKLAQEKGLKRIIKINGYTPFYNKKEELTYKIRGLLNKNIIFAPTQTILQKWLRERHNIFISIDPDCTTYPKFCYSINRFIGNPDNLSEREWYWEEVEIVDWCLYKSYEQALEMGLQAALKIYSH